MIIMNFGFRPIDKSKFDQACSETLESLTEYFEELIESSPHLKSADVAYSEGVLTVHLGKFCKDGTNFPLLITKIFFQENHTELT